MVSRYAPEEDYSADVLGTFEKFRQVAVRDRGANFPIHSGMNHVQAQIIELVGDPDEPDRPGRHRVPAGHPARLSAAARRRQEPLRPLRGGDPAGKTRILRNVQKFAGRNAAAFSACSGDIHRHTNKTDENRRWARPGVLVRRLHAPVSSAAPRT